MSSVPLSVSRDFKGVWIPREVWLSPISCLEKCLWAEIHSLFDRDKGGCFATNEYLCKFLGVKERCLQKMISHLKTLGLLAQVAFDGRKRIIKAVMPKEDQEPEVRAEQRRTTVHLCGAQPCTPRMHNDAPLPSSIENKDYSKEEREGGKPPQPPPLPHSFFTFKRIKMALQKYDELVKDFGRDRIYNMLDRLDEYADINPKRFKQYACHAAVIRKWIRGDLPASEAAQKLSNFPATQKLWKNLKHGEIYDGYTCYITGEGIAFVNSRGKEECIKFQQRDFDEKFEFLIKSLGIKVPEGKNA